MNFNRLILAILIFISPIKLSSCDECDLIALADLVAKALTAPPIITFGSVTTFILEVANERDAGNEDCGTKEAGATKFLWQLFKRDKDTNEFEEFDTDEEFQDLISAGNVIGERIDFTILEPGTYKLEALTDSPDIVEERSEANNDEDKNIELKFAIKDETNKFRDLEEYENTNNYISINFEVVRIEGNNAKIIMVD